MSKVHYRKEMAEDIVQEVFLKVWKYRKAYKPKKASIRTWIYQITRNYIIDCFRKQKEYFSLKDNDFNYREQSLDDQVEAKRVLEKLCKLRKKDRELLQLRYGQELSIQEVADILGKSKNATKVAIHRALKKLRKILDEG